MNHGGSGILILVGKYVNAVHNSTLRGSSGENPGGFIIESKHGNFYYAGDTALHMDMQLIGQFHPLTPYCLLVIISLWVMKMQQLQLRWLKLKM